MIQYKPYIHYTTIATNVTVGSNTSEKGYHHRLAALLLWGPPSFIAHLLPHSLLHLLQDFKTEVHLLQPESCSSRAVRLSLPLHHFWTLQSLILRSFLLPHQHLVLPGFLLRHPNLLGSPAKQALIHTLYNLAYSHRPYPLRND